ncbi:hypothetical protein DFJ74DRAFT_688243 [Hyaloraphidium curvatum]|nr:hypothetical protein DFJ74DRAFT_688243 [Hyaloraphidium curvatum]
MASNPKFTENDIPDLSGKYAIVTGANIGIGYISARELAKRGANVVIIARNLEKGTKAVAEILEYAGRKDGVELAHVDLADLKAVKRFADQYKQSGKPLHVLMNNAGVAMTKFELTPDGYESQFAINHLSHFLLTLELLPLLRASAPSTVVNVSSESHAMPYPSGLPSEEEQADKAKYSETGAYGTSKLAQVWFTQLLSEKLGPSSGITVTALHPGTMIRTEITNKVNQESFLLRNLAPAISWLIGPTPEKGALTQLFLAVEPLKEGHQVPSGSYYMPTAKLAKAHGKYGNDRAMAEKCWTMSEAMVQKAVGDFKASL